MTTGGWIIMLLSVGGVTVFFGWCLIRVLSAPAEQTKRLHGVDIEELDEKLDR